MIESIIAGIISGIIASITFFIMMRGLKPKILVSDDIALEEESNNTCIYRVKVVNKSKADLSNIEYRLYYCRVQPNGFMIDIQEIKPIKEPFSLMCKYTPTSDLCEYAYRISYDIDREKFPINDQNYLMFSISAEHSVSNTMKSVSKKYYSQNVKRGKFETGVSLRIL